MDRLLSKHSSTGSMYVRLITYSNQFAKENEVNVIIISMSGPTIDKWSSTFLLAHNMV